MFTVINNKLAKEIGIKSAFLYSFLLEYIGEINKEFTITQNEIVENGILTISEIKDCTKKLKKAGYLQVEKKGIPNRNHYVVRGLWWKDFIQLFCTIKGLN